MKKFLTILSVISIFAACNDAGKKDGSSTGADGASAPAGPREKMLYTETMNIHNEVMAKIGKLKGYQKKVQQQSDSIKTMLASTEFPIPVAQRIAGELNALDSLGKKLQAADSAMFTWMDGFDPDPQLANTDANADYFEKKKRSAEVMKQQFYEALAAAEKTFGPK